MLGVLGELWLGVSQGPSSSVATYVAEHPSSTWLIGPAFAAVTGVAIKEGLCYGKPEAGLLALVQLCFALTSVRIGCDKTVVCAAALSIFCLSAGFH